MNQQPTGSPTSFAVTCPGCGQRPRFSVAADAPARGEAGGRERLAAVGQEARALGYGLLARKTGAGAL